jgi:divalent metal cation (Fe/Co/Zn/Cd) transporter
VLHVDGRTEVSLHLKLPADLTLEEAHRIASDVERVIEEALPQVDAVQTHLEPLAEEAEGHRTTEAEVARDIQAVTRIVVERTGDAPRDLRFLATPDGLVVFLTLGMDASVPLDEAHRRASEIEEQIRGTLSGIAEIIVHTEP